MTSLRCACTDAWSISCSHTGHRSPRSPRAATASWVIAGARSVAATAAMRAASSSISAFATASSGAVSSSASALRAAARDVSAPPKAARRRPSSLSAPRSASSAGVSRTPLGRPALISAMPSRTIARRVSAVATLAVASSRRFTASRWRSSRRLSAFRAVVRSLTSAFDAVVAAAAKRVTRSSPRIPDKRSCIAPPAVSSAARTASCRRSPHVFTASTVSAKVA